MFGLTLEDMDNTIELWSTNVRSFSVFEAMGTQWRTGMSGPTGLDYQALPVVMKLAGIKKPKAQREVFSDIRVMEQEALKTMADNRDDKG